MRMLMEVVENKKKLMILIVRANNPKLVLYKCGSLFLFFEKWVKSGHKQN